MLFRSTPDTQPALPPEDQPEAAPPPARRRRPWLRLLLPTAALLLGMLAALGWLTATPQGFATLWRWAGTLSNGSLQLGHSEGTLWHGFHLQQLRWQRGGSELAVDSVQLDWAPQALWRGQLHIRRLALGNVRYVAGPASQPAAAPQAPDSLALPLDVRHVTLYTGQLAAALGTLGPEALHEPLFWWGVAALPVTGLLNVGVSFGLALLVALRSRNVRVGDRARLRAAIWRRVRHQPLSFLLPPRAAS